MAGRGLSVALATAALLLPSFVASELTDDDLLPNYLKSIAYSHTHTLKNRYTRHPQDVKWGGDTAGAPGLACEVGVKVPHDLGLFSRV